MKKRSSQKKVKLLEFPKGPLSRGDVAFLNRVYRSGRLRVQYVNPYHKEIWDRLVKVGVAQKLKGARFGASKYRLTSPAMIESMIDAFSFWLGVNSLSIPRKFQA